MKMSLVVLLCIMLMLQTPCYAFKGTRTPGAMMEYAFEGQRTVDLVGTKCSNKVLSVPPLVSYESKDFGNMIINDAKYNGGCRVDYLKDHTGVRLYGEVAGGKHDWRIKSEKQTVDMFGTFAADQGYTIDMWVGLSAMATTSNLFSILLDTIFTPDQYDTDPIVTNCIQYETNFLNSPEFATCNKVHASTEAFYDFDPGVMRISQNGLSMYYDEKMNQGGNTTPCTQVADDMLFPSTVSYIANYTLPPQIQHVTVRLQKFATGDYKLNLALNGTKKSYDATGIYSAIFNPVGGTTAAHSWPDASRLHIGHQFNSNPATLDIMYFAMYNYTLTDQEVRDNYNAWLPNSAPVVKTTTITVAEDVCTPVTLDIFDFDTEAMTYWANYFKDLTSDRTGEVDATPSLYISALPVDGFLYSDAGCTSAISTTFTQDQYAIASANDKTNNAVNLLYYKAPNNKNGAAYTTFSVWASDGDSHNGEGPTTEVTVDVTTISDIPSVSDVSQQGYLDTCFSITLIGNDIDDNKDIKMYNVTSYPDVAALGGTSNLYTDVDCVTIMTSEIIMDTNLNTDSVVIYYKGYGITVSGGSSVVGTDFFEYVAIDLADNVSPIGQGTVDLLNPIFVTQSNTVTISEDTLTGIILYGGDARDTNAVLAGKIETLPKIGTIYASGSSIPLTVGAIINADCISNAISVPCIDYDPPTNVFGTNADSFTYSVSLSGTQYSSIGFVNVSINNGADSPLAVCPSVVLTNLKAGDASFIDTYSIDVGDVDNPAIYTRYRVNMFGTDLKVKFSLPNGIDFPRCTNKNDCCDEVCELYVESGDIFQREHPNFASSTTFYASWRAIQSILSEINVRGGSTTEFGEGTIAAVVEDRTGLSSTCTVSFNVQAADEYVLGGGIGGSGIIPNFTDWQLYSIYGGIALILLFVVFVVAKEKMKKMLEIIHI